MLTPKNFVDKHSAVLIQSVSMKAFSTARAAEMLGLKRENLQRAIRQGKVKAPRLLKVGSVKIRLWTPADVERARKKLKRN
jgi:hypothetical protein